MQTTGGLALSSAKENEHNTCPIQVARLRHEMERMPTRESYESKLRELFLHRNKI